MDAEIGSIIEINGVMYMWIAPAVSGILASIYVAIPQPALSYSKLRVEEREDKKDVIFKKVDDNETS